VNEVLTQKVTKLWPSAAPPHSLFTPEPNYIAAAMG
jgi:hypothetical protein